MLRIPRAGAPILIAVLLACIGCSASLRPPMPPATEAPPAELTTALPGLPGGETDTRQAQIADGVGVLGNVPFDSYNGTPDGSELLLAVPDPASTDTAWAVYQIPESVGDTIEAFKFDIQYLDPDPLVDRGDEGYWVGYADYATGQWVIDGPFTLTSARAFLPPAADVVSPGGFYYALVLVTGANQARVRAMYYAWSIGPGYEEYWVGRPQGHSPGQYCDIHVDNAGEPHIAYFNSPYALNRHWADLRVAHRSSGSWVYDDIILGYEPRWSRLALGYVGGDIKRAVLAANDDSLSPEIWLYYDDGTGFDAGQLVTGAADLDVLGAITFVNDADDPSGPLNLLVIAYAVPDAPQAVQTKYVTYDEVALSAEQDLFGSATRRPGRLSLTTTANKQAVAAVPDKPADWELNVGALVGGVWDFATIPAWGPLTEVEEDEEDAPDFVALEAPGRGVVAGYVREYRGEVRLALYNGVDWQETVNDYLPTGFQYPLDIVAFTSGRIGLLDNYGEMKPLLRWGMTASGEEYGRQFIETEPYAMQYGSLAVDAVNDVHIAAYNPFHGELTYILRKATGKPAVELVDNGGLQLGGSAFMAWPVYVGEELHVFYVNSTHPGVLHAHNVGGIWLKEGEVVASGGIPYYVTGVGYLADRNLVYCGYIDFFKLGYMVTSGTPGGSDWLTVKMTDALTEIGYIGDDESEVAVVYFAPQILAEGEIRMAYGDPRVGTSRTATISMGDRRLAPPMSVAYNPVGEHWGLVANFEYTATAHYYYEDPTGIWLGPYTIAALEGPGAEFRVNHLSYLTSDGAPRILAGEIADGDTQFKISVYTAPPGSTSFSPLYEVLNLDMTLAEIDIATAAANPDGEPAIAVMHKLLADPAWDVEMFALSGVDTWSSVVTWDCPIVDGAPIVAVSDSNKPCVAAIETDSTLPEYGQPVVYYPW